MTFHDVAELQALSLDELTALWDSVPTERQRRYRAAYERELRNAGANGSDLAEQQVAEALLARYVESALVPIGLRWARTPSRLQAAAREGTDLAAPEAEATTTPSRLRNPVIWLLGAAGLILVLLILPRLGRLSDRTASPTTVVTGRTMTPTAIALEDQDSVIRGSDGSSGAFYPVNLRVALAGEAQPRVFVVQRRQVKTAEWNFDPNPDTASFLAGLSVRPVLGIPWSVENAALFEALNEGATFTLQMNTGAALRYIWESSLIVSRSETGVFRQVGPGLVLTLIGERDADGGLTGARTVITARYEVTQELSRDGALSGTALLPTEPPTPTFTPSPPLPPEAYLTVEVLSAEAVPGLLTVRVRLTNEGTRTVQISGDMFWLAQGEDAELLGERVAVQGMPPWDLLPGQVAEATLRWLWDGEAVSHVYVAMHEFEVQR